MDEANIEFSSEPTDPQIDTSDSRVIRMRTFSKAHGMAGARIGYIIGHKELITGINKIRLHFAVNRIAQVGALASLDDPEHVAYFVNEVDRGRKYYYNLATSLNLSYIPSAANS